MKKRGRKMSKINHKIGRKWDVHCVQKYAIKFKQQTKILYKNLWQHEAWAHTPHRFKSLWIHNETDSPKEWKILA